MLQLLPCSIPTLQSNSTGNWTWLDNVLGTEGTLDAIIACDTEPAKRGPKTDHLPIILTLELAVTRKDDVPRPNWREVDWEKFKKVLSATLTPTPPLPPASEEEFQQMAKSVMWAITSTTEACVPLAKPCPHSKCWWTSTLSDLHKQVAKLSRKSHQMRGLPDHPCHREHKALKNHYADEIAATKKQHWLDWLEDIEGNDLWTANCYISSTLSD
ncbi:hypothetical protein BDR06DRAFT_1047494, partial [Suillus hirtellus]